MADKFRDIVARIGAVFREQRKIDAQRALQRYHHLLAQPGDIALERNHSGQQARGCFRKCPRI
ncbi:hypothetical protein [Bradyrhizobium shewense]|nr:hypothetical protein [Bradyrhizobium shewense]